MSSSSSSSAPWVRPTAITCAPAWARAEAEARPMPRVAPVTRAMRPASGLSGGSVGIPGSGAQQAELLVGGVVAAFGDLAIQQAGGIVAGEVVIGELRIDRVAFARVHGPVQALHRQAS